MADALKFLFSFLRFAAQTAPQLAPEIKKLAQGWAQRKGIPVDTLLPALDDSLNTTGVPMPPMGANPALSDGELLAIVEFIRSLRN